METPAPHTPASLRARLGLSQVAVAELATARLRETSGTDAAVSAQTVARAEKGGSPSLDHLCAIAHALQVTRDAYIDAIHAVRARRAPPSRKARRARKGAA